ncbi:MAG: hypothetical protein J4F36_11350 [Nitrosopumilaceae archaeon]|nr:hypothetical protein [Nitrosopumilaceae archaeon]
MTNIIFFTGITGTNKKKLIKNIITQSGRESEILHIDFEHELTNPKRPGMPPSSIPDFLDIPNPYHKVKIIQDTFAWIKSIISKNPDKQFVFINVHLSYYKNSEFFPPLNTNDFISLVASFPKVTVKIINLIDDIFAIWQSIKEREDIYLKTSLRLSEILAWRSLESLRSESLRITFSSENEGQFVNNYLVSVRHPYTTFQNLIFSNIPQTLYLSYPITYPRTDAPSMKEVNDYRHEMHQFGNDLGVAIFDPVTIDELSLKFVKDKALESDPSTVDIELTKSDRWSLEISEPLVPEPNWPIKIPVAEIEQVETSISDQVQARDYALVDAANILAVYRPYYKGNRSDGVDAEIKHAKEIGNAVVVYSLEEDETAAGLTKGSPFASKTHYFQVKEKFIEHLQKLICKDKETDK